MRKAKKKRLFARLKKMPHLFQKSIITHCIIVLTVAALYSLYEQAHGAEMTDLFIAIGAVFGSELAMSLIKTLFKKEEEKTDEASSDEPGI